MVPRLGWHSVMRTKVAATRLLGMSRCTRVGLHCARGVERVLEEGCAYVKPDGLAAWRRDVERDVAALKERTQHRFDASLWGRRLQQMGVVFHVVNVRDLRTRRDRESRGWCASCCRCVGSAVCNCCRCRCCSPSSSRFVVYRADAKTGFDEVLASSRMASDHMPQVYLQVLEALDVDKLRELASLEEQALVRVSRLDSSVL